MTKRERDRKRRDLNAAETLFRRFFPQVPLIPRRAGKDCARHYQTCLNMVKAAREELRDEIMGASIYELQDV